jgi:hypothetical protein
MNKAVCPICNSSTNSLFNVLIQGERSVELNTCPNCEFAFYPDQNWISDSFSDELNSLDVGSTDRTIIAADYLSVVLKSLKLPNGRFLDYGGGYGLLSRIMRDRGFNFENYDPYTKQIFPTSGRALGNPIEQKYDAITLIEVALHFEDPVQEFKKLLEQSDIVLFTAVLTDEKLDPDWWYLSLETGQHIALFSSKTLEEIANNLGVKVTSDGKFFHVFHRKELTKMTRILAKRQYFVFALASLKAATAYLRRSLSATGSLLEADERNAKENLTSTRAKKTS